MDLTLGSSMRCENDVVVAEGLEENGCSNNNDEIEKEHMFDKVVTPSDVGKLNRLVIPKQHAERYFPLDSCSTTTSSSNTNNQKGLLLNFEDCNNGKLWRFRYSYWNSSQSYVMTKGWSRFVKDKSLDAGDIVSFHRGLRHSHRHRLYIDCRRRPVSSSLLTPSFRWAGRLYSLSPAAVNYHNYPFQSLHHQPTQQLVRYQQVYGGATYNHNNFGSGPSLYCLPGDRPMIIDSVPVPVTSTTNSGGGGGDGHNGKKLRLFGVNMEYCSSSSSSPSINNHSPAINMENEELQEEMEEEEAVCFSSSSSSARKGQTSVLFDLSPSFQCRPSSS